MITEAQSFAAWELDDASDHAHWALKHGIAAEDVAAALADDAGLELSRRPVAQWPLDHYEPGPVVRALLDSEWAGWRAANAVRMDQSINPRSHRKPKRP